jgi:hypothetical protein
MPVDPLKTLLRAKYHCAALRYLHSMSLENFAEAVPQADQRERTLASLGLLAKKRRSDVHLFNELLVQYPRANRRWPGQVVADNMVVVSKKSIDAGLSYDLPFQPVRRFGCWIICPSTVAAKIMTANCECTKKT